MTTYFLTACAFASAISVATRADAQEWVLLDGGRAVTEIDLNSITQWQGMPTATVRLLIREERGLLATYFVQAAHCREQFVYLRDGEIHSSWSQRVVPVPNLPERDRTFSIPSQNPAIQGFFDFLCVTP